jgi:hypothetical protein
MSQAAAPLGFCHKFPKAHTHLPISCVDWVNIGILADAVVRLAVAKDESTIIIIADAIRMRISLIASR